MDNVTTREHELAAVWLPLSYFAEWASNPRKNDQNARHVADLIIEFGFGSPVLAREDNGELIAGHTRLKACRLLAGLWAAADEAARAKWSPDARRIADRQDVPARFMPLDEGRAHLLALADNRAAELSPWDLSGLQAAMSDYELDDLKLAGWDSAALDKLSAELLQAVAGPDDPDEPRPEWDGMPEFEQPDTRAERTLIVHFATQADCDRFAQVIGQSFTLRAKTIWYPEVPRRQHTATHIVGDEAP